MSETETETETEPPLLADVYPALVSFLDAALVSEGEYALAQVVMGLRFHGWCGCSPTCSYLRTAVADRADSTWIHLDDEAPRVWLQFDQDRTSFGGMEICEFDLGPAPALDRDRPSGLG
ncbi:hypothetical protein K7B10_00870 [Streptomyces flavotricini]|uniref:Uncharacterized protein n=1 Tax=Streptomyces flavotricini TaxID=66888 RepID=A0ABS8DXG0_9ACTN|nr:hypothetical protein [Streptomyces flavotricini]MCC0093373.1 hypothetical protein [Streptomyces flavotricini]